nr:hypothetical protein [Candidatus Sigynarchaeota archaeon]
MIWEILGPFGIVFLILLWVFVGFSLKYIDQIVDEGRIVKTVLMWSVMAFAGITVGFFMAADSFTGGCALALILGMIVTKKIDSKLWVIFIMIVLGAYISFLNILVMAAVALIANFIEVVIVFIIVFVMSVLDELFHDFSAKKKGIIKKIGDRRLFMKIMAVIMAFVFSFVLWFHAIAWLLFDITYEITAYSYIKKVQKSRNPPNE